MILCKAVGVVDRRGVICRALSFFRRRRISRDLYMLVAFSAEHLAKLYVSL